MKKSRFLNVDDIETSCGQMEKEFFSRISLKSARPKLIGATTKLDRSCWARSEKIAKDQITRSGISCLSFSIVAAERFTSCMSTGFARARSRAFRTAPGLRPRWPTPLESVGSGSRADQRPFFSTYRPKDHGYCPRAISEALMVPVAALTPKLFALRPTRSGEVGLPRHSTHWYGHCRAF